MKDEFFWHLIARELSGEASADDEEKLEKYFSDNEEFKAVYKELKEQWQAQQKGLSEFYQDDDQQREKLKSQLARELVVLSAEQKVKDQPATIPIQRKFNWQIITKYAAAILLILMCAAGFWFVDTNFSMQPTTEVTAAMVTKFAPKGQKITVVLPDNSVVKLNSNSKISYPSHFLGNSRKVTLEGEAFFDVERDESKPFLIQTNDVTTTVLGTSFNINAYPGEDEIKVAVVTGKVRVKGKLNDGKEETVYLLPQEMAIFNDDTSSLEKVDYEQDNELGWKHGVLQFDHANSRESIRILENWYDINIYLTNGHAIAGYYTGSFEDESLEHVLNSMGKASGFTYTINGKNVEIQLN